MRGNRYEDILMVEDNSDILGLSFNTLIENKYGNIRITRESQAPHERITKKNGNEKSEKDSDLSYTLVYTKPSSTKNKASDLLIINSKFKIIPLLLLVGPSKEMEDITRQLDMEYYCFKEPVNFRKFIEKIKKMPMFWASIDTITDGNGLE